MYEKLESCPVCNHTQFHNYLICTDHAHTKESFALVKCNKCSHIFTNPRPLPTDISKYYDFPEYVSHSNSTGNLLTSIPYKLARTINLRYKKSLITKYTDQRSLLDFGCGTGDFLSYLKRNGWQVEGVEPSDEARQVAASALGDSSIHSSLNKYNKGKYSAITAWHVLEHVHEVKETLQKLRKRLTNNGKIFIALPNPLSYDALHYSEYWAGYDVPRHLHHFTIQSIQKLLSKCKLHLIDTRPMYFDSFYVSILSEKYSGNHQPITKGLKTGYKSNMLAKNSLQYSSNIFIASK